jgi:hypothetical protein
MQLITATLSPIAMSCAIGSTSSKDLWNRLKEQFSTVSRTSIFQMKFNLQTIKKGEDSISQYLHRICCYPIFDPCFDKFSEKIQKIAKNIENPKKYIFNTFASFLAFLASSQKNLNFQRHLERVQLLTRYF